MSEVSLRAVRHGKLVLNSYCMFFSYLIMPFLFFFLVTHIILLSCHRHQWGTVCECVRTTWQLRHTCGKGLGLGLLLLLEGSMWEITIGAKKNLQLWNLKFWNAIYDYFILTATGIMFHAWLPHLFLFHPYNPPLNFLYWVSQLLYILNQDWFWLDMVLTLFLYDK